MWEMFFIREEAKHARDTHRHSFNAQLKFQHSVNKTTAGLFTHVITACMTCTYTELTVSFFLKNQPKIKKKFFKNSSTIKVLKYCLVEYVSVHNLQNQSVTDRQTG